MRGAFTVGGVEVRASNLMTPMGLMLDEVRVAGADLRLETDPFSLSALAPGTFEATVGERSLEVFLNAKAPGGLRGFEVQIRENGIQAQATMMMIVPMKVSALCHLRIEDAARLLVDLVSVDVMGVGAKGLVEGHLARLNPILDASEWPLEARLESVRLGEAAITLRGTAKPR